MSDFYSHMMDACTYKYLTPKTIDRRIAQEYLELAWEVRRGARSQSREDLDHIIERIPQRGMLLDGRIRECHSHLPFGRIHSKSMNVHTRGAPRQFSDDLSELSAQLASVAAGAYQKQYQVGGTSDPTEVSQNASVDAILDVQVFPTQTGGWSWGPRALIDSEEVCHVFATKKEAQRSADAFYEKVLQKTAWVEDEAKSSIHEFVESKSSETWCEEAAAQSSCMGGAVLAVSPPDLQGRQYVVAYRTFVNECTSNCRLFQVLRKDVEKLPNDVKMVHAELVECSGTPRILCYVFLPGRNAEVTAQKIRNSLDLKT
jgi:hypothetical protein